MLKCQHSFAMRNDIYFLEVINYRLLLWMDFVFEIGCFPKNGLTYSNVSVWSLRHLDSEGKFFIVMAVLHARDQHQEQKPTLTSRFNCIRCMRPDIVIALYVVIYLQHPVLHFFSRFMKLPKFQSLVKKKIVSFENCRFTIRHWSCCGSWVIKPLESSLRTNDKLIDHNPCLLNGDFGKMGNKH